jgi:hypothetical protein
LTLPLIFCIVILGKQGVLGFDFFEIAHFPSEKPLLLSSQLAGNWISKQGFSHPPFLAVLFIVPQEVPNLMGIELCFKIEYPDSD